jgi:anti-sigma28 factor (negative regulator of flagellin synthesis)
MKIHPTQRSPQRLPAERDREPRASAGSQVQATPVPAARVERSSFAASLAEAEPARVRHDVVEDVRRALADGSFEASVDLEHVLDSLLADL